MAIPDTAARVQLRVADMDCPSCVIKIEGRLKKVQGVTHVSGSPVSRVLLVEYDGARVTGESLRDEVGKLGYSAHALDGREQEAGAGTWSSTKARLTYAAVASFVGALALLAAGVNQPLFERGIHTVGWPDVFFIGAALIGGLNFFDKGFRAARAGALDMNFLMTIAIFGAIGVGEFLEAGAIAFLFSAAELLESYSVDRARAAVASLAALAPDIARVERDGVQVMVPAEALVVGDVLLVHPGERIGGDGRVVEGLSEVDQSALTGESLPVEARVGSQVFAGTINREGFLRVVVERPPSQSALARIIELVEQAEASKTQSERFVDSFARYYTPIITIAAALIALGPPLLLGAPFVLWFVRGLTLLVIACPCALVISTPVAVVSGVTAAARRGVLIKGGTFLEASGRVKVVAFDKTGTLTHGHPLVEEVVTTSGATVDEILQIAAAVESRSEHPIGVSVRSAAREKGLAADRWAVSEFRAIPGMGARAELDGVPHRVGRPEMIVGQQGAEVATAMRAGGRTVVGVDRDGELLGWIALGDSARSGTVEVVRNLKKAGVEWVVLLTGDNQETADRVGTELGVDEVCAGLMPEEKVEAIRRLEASRGPVAMVGDGVNDAPALAVATVGIAMGAAGSSTALETADIALMSDDLSALPYLVRLSKRANRIIRQNVAIAILVKAVLVVGVPLGWVSLVLAVVVGDLGVSLTVIFNALRLARTEA